MRIRILPFALLFLLGSLYLYSFSGYIFFEQEKSSLFLLTFSYLSEHLNQPGGFLEYLGNFQSSLYYYPLAGALILSLEIVGIVYLTGLIGFKLAKRRFYFLPFLTGAALFYLQIHVEYSAINNLGILCQLFLFYVSITYLNGKTNWIPVILFPVLYFFFGSFSFLFLTMISIHFIQKNEKLKLTILWLWGIIFFFTGSEFLFFQSTKTLLSFPYSSMEAGGQTAAFLFVTLLITLFPVLTRVKLKQISSLRVQKIRLEELIPYLIILVLALLSVSKVDNRKIHFFELEKLFYEQKYDEVIAYSSRFPPTHSYSIYYTNMALAETGKLSESFFRFRQRPDGHTLFLPWEENSAILSRGGYFYYAIGMINEAHHWAYEEMVLQGLSPETLKLMIKTDLIKGKYKTAEKYIAILENSIFYRKEARYLLSFLYNDEAIALHPEMGSKKALDVKIDFFLKSDNPAYCLDLIIDSDSTNFMALEYKLAWLMLQKNIQGIVDLLPVMEKSGYSHMPLHVQEVVLVYLLVQMGDMPELERLHIDPQTERRFQIFNQTFMQFQGNKQMLKPVLARDFSDTYWYYSLLN